MSYTIEKFNSLDARLLAEWQQLWDRSPLAHFFNHPCWCLACAKAFPDKAWHLIALHDDNKLLAVLPLITERRFGIKTLACPGGKHLGKCSLLVESGDPRILNCLAEYLAAQGNFYLSEMECDACRALCRDRENITMRKASVNPYFSLAENPFGCLSNKGRRQMRSHIRNCRNHLLYRCFKGSEPKGLDIAFAVDKLSMKRKRGQPTFVAEQDRRFYRHLAAEYKDRLVICVLFYDDAPVVFEIGFIYGHTYHADNTAYDCGYKCLSPRKLLLYYSLPRLQREGFKIFDFSRGQNSLKREFTPLYYEQYDAYYAKSVLVRYWWKFFNNLYSWLQQAKLFYCVYLKCKRVFVELHDAFSGKAA